MLAVARARLALVSATALLTTAAAASTPAATLSPEIVGGQASSQWPGVGAVLISLGGGSVAQCTGFAIAPQWVMSAAHCLLGASPGAVFFLTGADVTDPLSPDVTTYDVDQVIVDPNFNINDVTAGHDAGLIHIKDVDLPFLPLKLNTQSLVAASVVGTHMLTMGYGTTSGAGSGDGIKRLAQVTISNLEGAFIEIDNTTTGTCSGDSGGPAYVYDTDGFPLVLGLASFGDQNCQSFGGFQRIDREMLLVTAAVTTGLCTNGQSCEGIFRDGVDPPL